MTTNGSFARGDAAWIARATSSLPVPVSPWTSTLRFFGAMRSSVAKSSRIDVDSPTSSPNDVRSLAIAGAAAPSTSKRSVVSPTTSSAPGASSASTMRCAPSHVPFVLPASRTWTRSPSRVSSRWTPLTPGSASDEVVRLVAADRRERLRERERGALRGTLRRRDARHAARRRRSNARHRLGRGLRFHRRGSVHAKIASRR